MTKLGLSCFLHGGDALPFYSLFHFFILKMLINNILHISNLSYFSFSFVLLRLCSLVISLYLFHWFVDLHFILLTEEIFPLHNSTPTNICLVLKMSIDCGMMLKQVEGLEDTAQGVPGWRSR